MARPKYLVASGGKLYCPKHDLFFNENGTCWNCDESEKAPVAAEHKPAVHAVATGGK